jgi:hypothetical protein
MACSLAAILVGWHVFLFGMFYVFISIYATFVKGITLSDEFLYIVLAVSVMVCGAASYFLGMKAYGWFMQRKPKTAFVLLGVLLLSMLLFFPRTFTFAIIAD